MCLKAKMLYLLNLFEQLIVEGVVIDNFVFRLHRKLTFIMLTVFAVAMASGIITTEPIEYSSNLSLTKLVSVT